MKNFNKRFPVFSSVLSRSSFDGLSFIFIYHLNVNNAPFLEAWLSRSEVLGVISIPYSEVVSVKETLSKIVKITTPKKVEEIPQILLDLCLKHKDKKIVLVEIGGYSSFVSEQLENVVLSVEDTHQGHWLQQKNAKLSYPVVSIANTEVKKLENRLIGESITRTIEKILRSHAGLKNLSRQNICVISYGGIGSSVCLALRNRGIFPHVYDKDPIRQSQAIADGYKVNDRSSMLRSSDIIIGCTGKPSMQKNDFSLLKKGCYLFSGSSKQVEFSEMIGFLEVHDVTEDTILQKITMNKSFIHIGYFGQPINFLDTIEPEEFDLQVATLLECFNYGSTSKLKNMVHSLPIKHQSNILDLYVKSRCKVKAI